MTFNDIIAKHRFYFPKYIFIKSYVDVVESILLIILNPQKIKHNLTILLLTFHAYFTAFTYHLNNFKKSFKISLLIF